MLINRAQSCLAHINYQVLSCRNKELLYKTFNGTVSGDDIVTGVIIVHCKLGSNQRIIICTLLNLKVTKMCLSRAWGEKMVPFGTIGCQNGFVMWLGCFTGN